MVVTRSQAQILINYISNLSINQQVQMATTVVKYVLSPFERKINTGYPQGINLYLQAKKEIDKEFDNLDISVSNLKDIIDNFISLSNKYVWIRLAFMVDTGAGANNIFMQIYNINIFRYAPSSTCIFWTARHWKFTKSIPSKCFW